VILEFLKNRIIILFLTFLWIKFPKIYTWQTSQSIRAPWTVLKLFCNRFRNTGCLCTKTNHKIFTRWIRIRISIIQISWRKVLGFAVLLHRCISVAFLLEWLFCFGAQHVIYACFALLQRFFTFRTTVFWICCFCYFLKDSG